MYENFVTKITFQLTFHIHLITWVITKQNIKTNLYPPGLSQHPCVHHDMMDTFGCRCTLVSHQYRVSLGQPKSKGLSGCLGQTHGRLKLGPFWSP